MQTSRNNICTSLLYRFCVIAGAMAVALSLPAAAHAQGDIGALIRQALSKNIRDVKQQADSEKARGLGGGCAAYDGPALAHAMPYGRLADPRINHNTIGPYVCRWYLERAEPHAASSDVIHPVTYLIDPDVPAPWRPYIIQAVHEWDAAFDAIGLRHVLTVRDATPQDSVTPPVNVVHIRSRDAHGILTMSTACTAVATTGQMTTCTIWVNGSAFQDAGRTMCRATAISDPAVPLSCPDSLLAFNFRFQVAHEVGHSLGLNHNFYAGMAYPTDSLQSARFIHTWGFTPSVMVNAGYDQYTPPDAHVPYADRWARVGPYDRWAIAWAYRSIPDATSSEAERPTLEQWRAAQDTAAYLRVSIDGPEGDRNAVGGDDPVRAIEFRARDRVAVWQRLFREDTAATLAGVTNKNMPGQWQDALTDLIADVIGGRRPQPPYPRDRAAIRYAPIDGARQLRAVRLVLADAVYGQDPYLQLLKSVHAHRPFQPSLPMDSLPLLFDTLATNPFPDAPAWRHAQLHVLTTLTGAFPKLPPAVALEACHYIAAASSKLTHAVSTATSPAAKAAATALRTALTPAPGICHCRPIRPHADSAQATLSPLASPPDKTQEHQDMCDRLY
jgi:hypothetical protein